MGAAFAQERPPPDCQLPQVKYPFHDAPNETIKVRPPCPSLWRPCPVGWARASRH